MFKSPILNIEETKKQLDEAEIYEDDEGNKIQTIYLGSILSLTPSGKIYTLWANSNLEPCPRCKGKGEIDNKHKSTKKVKAITKKLDKLTHNGEQLYIHLNRHQQKLIDKLCTTKSHYDSHKTCTECYGIGSLEARLDSDWWEQLENELEQINAWTHNSESDGCDVMISKYVEE